MEPQEIPFGQYSALLSKIDAQQRQIDLQQSQILHVLDNHDDRIRRNEERTTLLVQLLIIAFFVTVLGIVVVFFIVRETRVG